MNENDSTFFKKGMFQNFDNKLRKWRKNGKSLLIMCIIHLCFKNLQQKI